MGISLSLSLSVSTRSVLVVIDAFIGLHYDPIPEGDREGLNSRFWSQRSGEKQEIELEISCGFGEREILEGLWFWFPQILWGFSLNVEQVPLMLLLKKVC